MSHLAAIFHGVSFHQVIFNFRMQLMEIYEYEYIFIHLFVICIWNYYLFIIHLFKCTHGRTKYGIHSLTQIALALCISNTIWNIIIIDARKCSVWVWSYSNVTNFEWGPTPLAKISFNGIKSDIKTEKIKKVIWIQC